MDLKELREIRETAVQEKEQAEQNLQNTKINAENAVKAAQALLDNAIGGIHTIDFMIRKEEEKAKTGNKNDSLPRGKEK